MKLDRNSNSDGRGKYAFFNLRTNQVEWGDTPEEFFVIKLKDEFAFEALSAYADAVKRKAAYYRIKARIAEAPKADDYLAEAVKWDEYESKIRSLATQAYNHPLKKLPD
jgi:hypothetical protein